MTSIYDHGFVHHSVGPLPADEDQVPANEDEVLTYSVASWEWLKRAIYSLWRIVLASETDPHQIWQGILLWRRAIESDEDELESESFHFGSLLAVIQSRNDEVNNVSTNLTYDVASWKFLMTAEAGVCGVGSFVCMVKWRQDAAGRNVRLASESEEFNQQEFRVRLDHYNFS
ncbi:hypothetical protein Tco_0295890 [Tanacetum coccineum]